MLKHIRLSQTLGTVLLLAGLSIASTQLTVASTGGITLPAPFFIETFDQVEEGSLPAGWTIENYTSELTLGLDLDDPNSEAYEDWVVISRDRVLAIGDAGGWDGPRRLNVAPGQIVNGEEVTSLVEGNFIYAESDQRGGSQVQYLYSPDINCSGKTSVFVSYHSVYEQNQDSIGSVEYSIDQGATWLPIVYMIDEADIKKAADTSIDGYATLAAPQGDTATYVDPVTGEDKGGYYGAFVGVSSNLWATLSAFISPRINDDPVESKRVELFRLPQADNQPKVRFRFAQAGTGSWYFGVDDFGLYTITQAIAPKISEGPRSQIASVGGKVILNVKATGTEPFSYLWTHDGVTIPGATTDTLTLTSVKPADAGDYVAVVSNAGGEAASLPAHLSVFEGTIAQDLVVHLKFDDDLLDSSGKDNDGTEVGFPSFSVGKIGSAVHIPSGYDYVSLGAPADLNFGTDTDFSISFWAKTIEWSSDPAFISNKDWDSGSNQGYVLSTDGDGHFQWNLAGPPGSRKDYDGPPGLFSDQNWHHIAVTFARSGNAVTYVDGAQVDSRSLAGSQNDVNTPEEMATNIGQDGTGAYGPAFADADIDDMGIWRRLLTPQEVAAIYAAGTAGKDLSTIELAPADLGSINVSRSGADVSFTWSAGTGVRLQKTTSLNPANWQDVPNTEGKGSIVEKATGAAAFYRLYKP